MIPISISFLLAGLLILAIEKALEWKPKSDFWQWQKRSIWRR